jgi:hypothetical protein
MIGVLDIWLTSKLYEVNHWLTLLSTLVDQRLTKYNQKSLLKNRK